MARLASPTRESAHAPGSLKTASTSVAAGCYIEGSGYDLEPVVPIPSARMRALFVVACALLASATALGAAPADVVVDDSLSGQLKAALSAGNLGLAIVLVMGGGLLTALSPCVYPLIPITLSILGARQASSALRGFLLAATYVGGMVVLYAALGVSFAWAGVLAGSALQSPLVTIGVAVFCVVMAASMFGAFELALPSGLQTRLSQVGGGGFQGAFVMGLVAGIIAAPCTGPVLSFVLTLIARERDLAKGGTLMFFYAIGMGLPFLVLGTFSQAIARMPKSGRWMETVKSVFGLLMLGAGLYYLMVGLAPVAAVFAPLGASGHIVGPILLVMGVAIGALHLSFKYTPVLEKVRKGVGVALSTLGLVAFLAWTNAPEKAAPGQGIAWVKVGDEETAVATFDAALARAQASGKAVMIDFGADWCIACKELDKFTFTDDAVQSEAAQRFVAIKVDATNETEGLTTLQSRYGVVGLPTIFFIPTDGTSHGSDKRAVIEPITGFVKAEPFLALMKKVP